MCLCFFLQSPKAQLWIQSNLVKGKTSLEKFWFRWGVPFNRLWLCFFKKNFLVTEVRHRAPGSKTVEPVFLEKQPNCQHRHRSRGKSFSHSPHPTGPCVGLLLMRWQAITWTKRVRRFWARQKGIIFGGNDKILYLISKVPKCSHDLIFWTCLLIGNLYGGS